MGNVELRSVEDWRATYPAAAATEVAKARPSKRQCTLCGYEGFFAPCGWPIRPEGKCPRCGSFERHRLLALAFDARWRRALHFSPERCLGPLLAERVAEVVTIDADPRRACSGVAADIQHLPFASSTFDLVICSHILEHVRDDHAALAEINRVLSSDGTAFIMTPLVRGWSHTYEAAVEDCDRVLHFLQHDHLRLYGEDLRDRICASGFSISEHIAVEPWVSKHGLSRGGVVFAARRSRLGREP